MRQWTLTSGDPGWVLASCFYWTAFIPLCMSLVQHNRPRKSRQGCKQAGSNSLLLLQGTVYKGVAFALSLSTNESYSSHPCLKARLWCRAFPCAMLSCSGGSISLIISSKVNCRWGRGKVCRVSCLPSKASFLRMIFFVEFSLPLSVSRITGDLGDSQENSTCWFWFVVFPWTSCSKDGGFPLCWTSSVWRVNWKKLSPPFIFYMKYTRVRVMCWINSQNARLLRKM